MPGFARKSQGSFLFGRFFLTDFCVTSLTPVAVKKPSTSGETGPRDCYLTELRQLLTTVVASNPGSRVSGASEDEAEDPRAAPMMWVSKWVDYSDKYGFGYALSDDSIGVVFNDLTKLLLLADGS